MKIDEPPDTLESVHGLLAGALRDLILVQVNLEQDHPVATRQALDRIQGQLDLAFRIVGTLRGTIP